MCGGSAQLRAGATFCLVYFIVFKKVFVKYPLAAKPTNIPIIR
jgi:hypothetical protein